MTTCPMCGSPWVEADGAGVLRCCDCDARVLPVLETPVTAEGEETSSDLVRDLVPPTNSGGADSEEESSAAVDESSECTPSTPARSTPESTLSDLVPTSSDLVPDEVIVHPGDPVHGPRPGPYGVGPDGDGVAEAMRGPETTPETEPVPGRGPRAFEPERFPILGPLWTELTDALADGAWHGYDTLRARLIAAGGHRKTVEELIGNGWRSGRLVRRGRYRTGADTREIALRR